jgi:hypothetical protein
VTEALGTLQKLERDCFEKLFLSAALKNIEKLVSKFICPSPYFLIFKLLANLRSA